MLLDQLLRDFGTSCGLPGLVLDENGCCSLVFDDRYEVTFTHDAEDGALLLSAPIVSATTTRAPMLRRLLESGYLGLRTRGGTISIDPEREIYVYWKRHDTAAFRDADGLRRATERFLTELVRLRRSADELENESGRSSAGLPPDAWLLSL